MAEAICVTVIVRKGAANMACPMPSAYHGTLEKSHNSILFLVRNRASLLFPSLPETNVAADVVGLDVTVAAVVIAKVVAVVKGRLLLVADVPR